MAECQTLQAGIAKRDITTEEPGTVILDRLFAKVLVQKSGARKFVLITMDAVAIGGICDIGDDFLPSLRQRIENELGIPATHVLVNASHTHPPGRILCDDAELIERTFAAVREAAANLTEVLMGSGTGHEARISMNRNLRLKNGRYWTVRHANPGPSDDEVAGVGPIDPEIGILRFDRLDGTPLAIVYNFACHLLFGDPQGSVTANFIGISSHLIEETLGHGAMAFFVQGAAGDVIDVGFKEFERPREIQTFGALLAQSTLEASRRIRPRHASLNVVNRAVELPRRTDIPQRIKALRCEQRELLKTLRFTALNFKSFLPLYLKYELNPRFPLAASYAYLQAENIGDDTPAAMDEVNRGNIEKYFQNLTTMETLARIEDDIATFERHLAINEDSGETTVSAELIGVRIGDCILLSAPLEMLTEVSLDIKGSSPYPHTFIAAFSNGYLHYGPPASDYDKGGYEVTECFLAPEWEQIYKDVAAQILAKLSEE